MTFFEHPKATENGCSLPPPAQILQAQGRRLYENPSLDPWLATPRLDSR